MSNKLSGVAGLLNKLDNALGKNRQKNTQDYKALNEERKKAFIKCNDGKNQFIFLTPEGAADPFIEWAYHQNLQEVSYYSIPCDAHNKEGGECLVCNIVDSLKTQDFNGNKHIWMPIEKKLEFYAPVINVASEATIAEGVKWLKLSKTIMDGIAEWLRNLEKDEVPFYDEEEPQRIIINYDKNAMPKDKYKLDKKNAKAFTAQQLADWKGTLKTVDTYMMSKSQDEVKKLVDAYFARIEDMVADAAATEKEQEDVKTESANETKVNSKLAGLKKN